MSVPYILTDTSVTVVINFTPKVIDLKHPNYAQIIALLKTGGATEAQLEPLLDIPKAIVAFTGGNIYVKDGKLFANGAEVRTSLGRIIMRFVNSGQPEFAEPLKAFLANVSMNPDPRAQIDLYDWVQASNLPITSDGMILAWKAVTNEYRSLFAPNDERFDHRIGKRVEQKRDECDANPDRTCSSGLHFCGAAYLKSYASGGARIVVVKIHPKDVVSFPTDYQLQKGRACGYDVVGEVPVDQVKDYYPQGVPVYTGFDPKPAVVEQLDLRDGDVVVTRDGATVTIANSDGKVCFTNGYVFCETGHCARTIVGEKTAYERPQDVVRVISRAKVTPRLGAFAVGQRWITRNGQTVAITAIDAAGGFPITADNGASYHTYGGHDDIAFYLPLGGGESALDLVRLMTDVA